MTDGKTVRLSRRDLKTLANGRQAKVRADDGTTVRVRSPRGGLPE